MKYKYGVSLSYNYLNLLQQIVTYIVHVYESKIKYRQLWIDIIGIHGIQT